MFQQTVDHGPVVSLFRLSGYTGVNHLPPDPSEPQHPNIRRKLLRGIGSEYRPHRPVIYSVFVQLREALDHQILKFRKADKKFWRALHKKI
jgi:hypothetical protein